MRIYHTAPPPPPPRPGQLDVTARPFSSTAIVSHAVDPTPFPVPPPPPPIPPRINQAAPSLSPHHTNHPGDIYGGSQNHGQHRQTPQLNLPAAGTQGNESWHSDAPLQAQIRAQKEEEARKVMEELRLEKERLQKKQEELERQALALEQQRREEYERHRETQERLERIKALAKEEEERRLERELQAEEERRQRAQWEEEEKIKRELEREQWRIEEEERNRRLLLQMADERYAAVFSMKEEMEAERRKQEAEEKAKVAERAAEAEIARLKEEEERETQARILQEQRDAEIARKLETTEEGEDQPSVNATTSHPASTAQTPQQRVSNDLPGYEQSQRPQATVSPPPPPPLPVHNEQADVQATHMGRPYANATANVTAPSVHPLPHNQSFPRLSPGGINPNTPNTSSHARFSMVVPPMHPQHPPTPVNPPTQHPGFPNAGTGQGPPYHNHFFPKPEAESPVVSSPGGIPQQRTGPNKLQRHSQSVGGGNPTGRPVVHNNGANSRQPTAPVPLGHIAGTPPLPLSAPALTTHSSVTNLNAARPPTSNSPLPSVPIDFASSPGAGGSSQPVASTSNPEPAAHLINEYPHPHGNASQQPIEPLSGISEDASLSSFDRISFFVSSQFTVLVGLLFAIKTFPQQHRYQTLSPWSRSLVHHILLLRTRGSTWLNSWRVKLCLSSSPLRLHWHEKSMVPLI